VDVNHHYLLQLATELNDLRPGARILDYGCGNAEIVEEGRKKGLNFYGADIFYDPNPETRIGLQARGLLGDQVREIRDGRIPFEDESFDLITSNMVFEHVEDMVAVLREVERVLRPGGLVVALFPTMEVWREAHTGLPFVHWMRPNSVYRRNYALILRACGFGTFKTRPLTKWVGDLLGYLDRYVYYRPRNVVTELFSAHFSVDWIERHHVAYRLERSRLRFCKRLLNIPPFAWFATAAFNRLAFVGLVARKPSDVEAAHIPAWVPKKLIGMSVPQVGSVEPDPS
jgi:SAM-dependent methyltransferase